jgi:hypothetical protein
MFMASSANDPRTLHFRGRTAILFNKAATLLAYV